MSEGSGPEFYGSPAYKQWACRQTAQWRNRGVGRRDFQQEWDHLRNDNPSVYLIDVDREHVMLRPKAHPLSEAEKERAGLYRDFIADVAARISNITCKTIAINVSDFPDDSFLAPVYAFQKRHGSPNILLPDVDFFYHDWYMDAADDVPVEAKHPHVVFVGASTGGVVTAEVLRDSSLPRLALAKALHHHPRISFKIGAAVQCEPDVRAGIESESYFSGFVEWREQLDAAFILSVDGNGAACSRVIRTLLSNSVLMKYVSDAELFYFDGLLPWVHYLPVSSVKEIEWLIGLHDRGEIDRRAIIDAAQSFVRSNLTRSAVENYTAEVLGFASAEPAASGIWPFGRSRQRGR